MMHIHINAGWQQFDGERALEYARSRETTSDFDRSRRQQLVMLAIRQRAFSLNATYGALQRYLARALPDRSVLASRVPFQLQDGSGRYWLPYGIGTPASIMTSLLQAQGWQASVGPATTQRVAQTQILDGSGGSAAATVAWLHDYFGGVVTTVAAPASGPRVTVLLGSDFTLKTFPAPAR